MADGDNGDVPGIALDESGKAVLDHLYNQTDPRAYYRTLGALDYKIPEAALTTLQSLIAGIRKARGRRRLKIVDMGCSYGIVGRMLRLDGSMDETIDHYASRHAQSSRAELLASDRALIAGAKEKDLEIVGLDAAENACAYAMESGAIDAAIIANLEEAEVPDKQLAVLDGADLVLSTGFIGYGGERSVLRALDGCGDGRPWMAHFVMRLYDFRPIRMALAKRGYVTRRVGTTYHQRRFASSAERQEIVERLIANGIDPVGLEDDGMIHAQCYVSRPAEEPVSFAASDMSKLRDAA